MSIDRITSRTTQASYDEKLTQRLELLACELDGQVHVARLDIHLAVNQAR